MREQLAATLVLVDAPDVNRERPLHPELAAEARRIGPLGHVRSDPDDDTRDGSITGGALDHRAFLGRVVHQSADAAEHGPEDRHRDGRVPLGGRHEHGFRRDPPRKMPRVIVPIAEEQTVVVALAVLREVIDQRRRRRSFGVEPVELLAERVRLLEHALRSPSEQPWIALVLDAKPPDLDAVDRLDTRR